MRGKKESGYVPNSATADVKKKKASRKAVTDTK